MTKTRKPKMSETIIESVQVPRADSFHTVRLIQKTLRTWYIGLPQGCSHFVGNGGKRETVEAFERMKKSCIDGSFSWPTCQGK
jgi:hypothetical protein